MMQIKNFEFLISDYTGTKTIPMAWTKDFNRPDRPKIYGQDDIEETVNKFMQTVNVINVNIHFATLNFNNNGGVNVLIEYVTVVYQKP